MQNRWHAVAIDMGLSAMS